MPNILPKKFSFSPGFWLQGHDETAYSSPSSALYRVLESTNAIKIWAAHTSTGLSTIPDFKGIYETYPNRFAYPIAFFKYYKARGKVIESELALPSPVQVPYIAGMVLSTNQQAEYFGVALGHWVYQTYYKAWIEQGGIIDFISFDGPINKMTKGGLYKDGGFTDAGLAVNALLCCMVVLKQHMPNVQFIYLENLPIMPIFNIAGIGSDYSDQTYNYTFMMNQAKSLGVGFAKVEIDCPWNFLVQPGQLTKLSNFIKTSKQFVSEVSLIVNSGDKVVDTKNPIRVYDVATEQKFTKDVTSFIYTLKNDPYFSGVAMPTRLCMQTWTTSPFSLDSLAANYNYMKSFC